MTPGKFLAANAAEWFQGLPENWSNVAGIVKPGLVADIVGDWGVQESDKIPCVSLFSGIGGLEAGVSWCFKPVAFVECGDYPCSVLQARMDDNSLPKCDIIRDVVGYKPSGPALKAEALTAGFPCQGISQAGSQGGLSDGRSSLVKETFNVFDRLPRARLLLLENVGALSSTNVECRRVFNYILKEAHKRGMALYWTTNKLANVGLQASRTRVFLLACKPETKLPKGPKIDHFVSSGWNPCNGVPMSEWLTLERCNKERMDTLGNVVVPRQACLGLAVIARMMAGDLF